MNAPPKRTEVCVPYTTKISACYAHTELRQTAMCSAVLPAESSWLIGCWAISCSSSATTLLALLSLLTLPLRALEAEPGARSKAAPFSSDDLFSLCVLACIAGDASTHWIAFRSCSKSSSNAARCRGYSSGSQLLMLTRGLVLCFSGKLSNRRSIVENNTSLLALPVELAGYLGQP